MAILYWRSIREQGVAIEWCPMSQTTDIFADYQPGAIDMTDLSVSFPGGAKADEAQSGTATQTHPAAAS